MTLFLDTEFNAHGGQLISIALVSDRDGDALYGVLRLPEDVHPWVQEHVVPILDQGAESEEQLRKRLGVYLLEHRGEDVVADWPEDFIHLLDLIAFPNGVRVNVDFNMRLVSGMEAQPERPHNALSDARALMRAWHGRKAA